VNDAGQLAAWSTRTHSASVGARFATQTFEASPHVAELLAAQNVSSVDHMGGACVAVPPPTQPKGVGLVIVIDLYAPAVKVLQTTSDALPVGGPVKVSVSVVPQVVPVESWMVAVH
jgi:hypothetical protein